MRDRLAISLIYKKNSRLLLRACLFRLIEYLKLYFYKWFEMNKGDYPKWPLNNLPFMKIESKEMKNEYQQLP